MLIVRNAQIQAIAEAAEENLRLRFRRHLERTQPEACAALRAHGGDKRVALRVRLGLLRARRRGFQREEDLLLFLELMCEFGRDFDRSPDVPWAYNIFRSPLPTRQKLLALEESATQARIERILDRTPPPVRKRDVEPSDTESD